MARVSGCTFLFLFALPSLLFCYSSSPAILHDQRDLCIHYSYSIISSDPSNPSLHLHVPHTSTINPISFLFDLAPSFINLSLYSVCSHCSPWSVTVHREGVSSSDLHIGSGVRTTSFSWSAFIGSVACGFLTGFFVFGSLVAEFSAGFVDGSWGLPSSHL